MQGTYEMMKQVLTGTEGEYEEITLVRKYKQELLPNILAYFYCKNYGMIYELSRKYNVLTESDKASLCLQVLDKCLRTYDEKLGVKLSTYFMKCYKNKLVEYQHRELCNTHKSNIFTVSIEICNDIPVMDSLYEDNSLDEVWCSYKLTNTDIRYCKLLNDGYTPKEISKFLNISKTKVYNDISKIKEKFLLNCVKST